MSRYRLDIWDEAEAELLDAITWYNRRRDGLGDQLLIQVERTLDLVSLSPLQYTLVLNDLRRAVVDRFPYSVIFRLRDDVIEILAIIHQSRQPQSWQQRRR